MKNAGRNLTIAALAALSLDGCNPTPVNPGENPVNHELNISAKQVGEVLENSATVNIKAADQDGLKGPIQLTADGQTFNISVPKDATQIDINETIEHLSAGGQFGVEVEATGKNPETEELETKTVTTKITTSETPNTAPTINSIDGNTTITEGDTLTLTVDATDGDGDSLTYSWKEGTTELGTDQTLTKDDLSVGEHTIEVTVSDGNGGVDSKSVIVNVEAQSSSWMTISDQSVDDTASENTPVEVINDVKQYINNYVSGTTITVSGDDRFSINDNGNLVWNGGNVTGDGEDITLHLVATLPDGTVINSNDFNVHVNNAQ